MPVPKLESEDGEVPDEYEASEEGHYRVEAPSGALICELSDEGDGR